MDDADWIVPNTFASRLVHDSGYAFLCSPRLWDRANWNRFNVLEQCEKELKAV